MKLIIAGSRTIIGEKVIAAAIAASKCRDQITEVVSGNARGVDKWGEVWARNNKIPLKIFKADWNRLGSAAGPIRNKQMGDYADGAVVIWDQVSTGSKQMYDYMGQIKKPRFLYRVNLEIDEQQVVWFNLPDGQRIRGY